MARSRALMRTILFGIVILLSLVAGCRGCKKATEPSNGNEWDPRNVSRNSGGAGEPRVAVDSQGSVHLVWMDDTPGTWEILYSRKSPAGEWSEARNISNSSEESWCPRITIDPSGNLHVVWEELRSTPITAWYIFYSMKPLGGEWSEPIFFPIKDSHLPEIGADAQGNVHLVAMGLNPLWYTVKVGGTWSEPEDIPGTAGALDPAMVVGPEGDVDVVFQPGRFPDEILYTMKPLGNEWIQPVNISESSDHSQFPSIALGEDKRIYVAWTEAYAYQTCFRIRETDGSWTEVDTVPGAITYFVEIAEYNEVLHFVWEQVHDILHKVKYENDTWSETENISNTTGDSTNSCIILDAQGHAHIAWCDETPGNWEIFYTVIQTK